MPPRSTVAPRRALGAVPKKAAAPSEVTTGRGAGLRNVVKRASEQAVLVKQQGGQRPVVPAAPSRPRNSAGGNTSARRWNKEEDSPPRQPEADERGAFDDVGGGYSPAQGSSKPADRDILDSHLSSSSQPGVNKEEILAKQ